MKEFKTEKLKKINSVSMSGEQAEKYRYGAAVISVLRFKSMILNEKCIVVAFEHTRHGNEWKKGVARYLGADLDACSFGDDAVFGRAV